MADGPITESQGREIIQLLQQILSVQFDIYRGLKEANKTLDDTLGNIDSSLEAIRKDAFEMEIHLRSIESNQG